MVNFDKILTFVLPIYNVDKYLWDCIESILNQGMSRDIYEIICINDCSTDNSSEVLSSIKHKYDNIQIFNNEENKGVSYSRNKGIALAKGQYIWFVDPDDYLAKNAVSEVLNIVKKENPDIILENYKRVLDCENESIMCEYTEYNFRTSDFLPTDRTGAKMCAIWCGVFSRDFLRSHNLLFNERMIAQEDTLFYYQLEQCIPKLIKTESILYCYRQRLSSVMHTKSEERSKEYYESMLEMYHQYILMLEDKFIKDVNILYSKIEHMKQNCATTLAMISDTKFVKKQLFKLKQEKIYPYKFRREAMTSSEKFFRKIYNYLMPVELFFWSGHFLFKIINKFRYR